MIKKTILWLLQSYFYLVPIAIIVAGGYLAFFGLLSFRFSISNIADGINILLIYP